MRKKAFASMWALILLLALYSWLSFSFSPAPALNRGLSGKIQSNSLIEYVPRLFRKEDDRKGSMVALKMSESAEEGTKGPEKKYLIAAFVTFLALLFDYFRMHNGIPFWAEGGRL